MDDSLWVKHIRGNFHRSSSSLGPAQLAAARDTFYSLLVRTGVQEDEGGPVCYHMEHTASLCVLFAARFAAMHMLLLGTALTDTS
jgi:hypothetical protein